MEDRKTIIAMLCEPRLQRQAGGLNSAILAEDTVSYEQFPQLAEFVAKAIDARIVERTDVFDTRLWKVGLNEPPRVQFRLVWQDFPCEVSLESIDAKGDAALEHVISRWAERLRVAP